MSKQPRGIRNHNPGNIEKGDPWQGLAADQSSDDRFAVFKSPRWGIRALARVLITYQDKHGLKTPRQMIDRWAPPVENDTNAYAEAVARHLGVCVDTPVNVHEHSVAVELVEAIIKHENGQQPYSSAQIDEGLKLAGIVPPAPVRVADRSIEDIVKVGAPAVGTVLAGLAGLEPWVGFGVFALIVVGYGIYRVTAD